MPAKGKDVKKRIRAIEGIQKVTRSMKLISTVKLKQAQQLQRSAIPYDEQLRDILAKLLAQVEFEDLLDIDLGPLISTKPAKRDRECLVVVSSDRGLCGGYNSQVFKRLHKAIAELREHGKSVLLLLIGRKAVAHCKRFLPGYEVAHTITNLPTMPTADLAEEIYGVLEELAQERIDGASLIYNYFLSTLHSDVLCQRIFPVDTSSQEEPTSAAFPETIFEPSPLELLQELLPIVGRNTIYQALLSAKTSELAQRVNAMSNATDNADELIDNLTLSYNKARQAAITQEISEIVAGSQF